MASEPSEKDPVSRPNSLSLGQDAPIARDVEPRTGAGGGPPGRGGTLGTIGAVLVFLLAVALVADAAIETYRSAARVWPWVAGAAGLLVAVLGVSRAVIGHAGA